MLLVPSNASVELLGEMVKKRNLIRDDSIIFPSLFFLSLRTFLLIITHYVLESDDYASS